MKLLTIRLWKLPIMMLAFWLAASAMAALQVGQRAPVFKARAALAGKPFDYSLADALALGSGSLNISFARLSIDSSEGRRNHTATAETSSAPAPNRCLR